jgi:hypothetical protein
VVFLPTATSVVSGMRVRDLTLKTLNTVRRKRAAHATVLL